MTDLLLSEAQIDVARSGVTRPLAIILNDKVNANNFGAGLGVTSDHLRLRNALDHAVTNRKTLVLPSGDYYLEAAWLTTVATGNIAIEMSPNAVIRSGATWTSGINTAQIVFNNQTNGLHNRVHIEGGIFDCSGIPEDANPDVPGVGVRRDCGININGMAFQDVTLQGMRFHSGHNYSGVPSSGRVDSWMFICGMSNVNITDCAFYDCDDLAIYVSGDSSETYGEFCRVTNNHFESLGNCVGVKRQWEEALISGNTVKNTRSGFFTGESGIQLPGKRITISNNTAWRCGKLVQVSQSDYSIITGNRSFEIGAPAVTLAQGIAVTKSSHCIVSDNIIAGTNPVGTYSAGVIGIQVDDEGATADNNLITNNKTRGLVTAFRGTNLTTGTNQWINNDAGDCTIKYSNQAGTEIVISRPWMFSVNKNNVNQTGVVTDADTKVTFGTVVQNRGAAYDIASDRCIPPFGPVRLTAIVSVSAGAVDGAAAVIAIKKNGAIIRRSTSIFNTTAAQSLTVSATDLADGDDYYEVFVTLSGAGNKTIAGGTTSTTFSGSTG